MPRVRWYTPEETNCLPTAAGSYILEFNLAESIIIRAGRLGLVRLGPGRLRYYGSARGPGGLRARIQRHLRVEGRRAHWHIDALTAVVPVARVMISHISGECELVQRDLKSGRWTVAIARFGSSDCRCCPGHLLAEMTGLVHSAKPVRC